MAMAYGVCQVCSPAESGVWRWRPCAGGGAPPGFACYVDGMPPVAIEGSLYWLLHTRSFTDGSTRDPPHDAPILSLSVGAERFGWVSTPPRLSRRIRHLTDLDGSLCAVVHDRFADGVFLLLTWSPDTSPSWSARSAVHMGSLPPSIRGEIGWMRHIVPLGGSSSGTNKILLATSRHKEYAYDVETGGAEEVFDMNAYVDVPFRNCEAQLFLIIGLHEERIAGVGRTLFPGDNRLQVKRGGDTVVGKREVSSRMYPEHWDRDEEYHKFRELIMQLGFPMSE